MKWLRNLWHRIEHRAERINGELVFWYGRDGEQRVGLFCPVCAVITEYQVVKVERSAPTRENT